MTSNTAIEMRFIGRVLSMLPTRETQRRMEVRKARLEERAQIADSLRAMGAANRQCAALEDDLGNPATRAAFNWAAQVLEDAALEIEQGE